MRSSTSIPPNREEPNIDAMRTTLDIDDELLKALLARHPGSSKREAVGDRRVPLQGRRREDPRVGRSRRYRARVLVHAPIRPPYVKLLPDTSVWVDYLRLGTSGPAAELDDHLQRESVLVCGPVLAGLLAGTNVEQREELWLALGSLPWAEIDHAGWREAGEAANDLRSSGASVPLTDVVIAISSVRSGATLWTRDRDFERIRAVLPALELRLDSSAKEAFRPAY